MSKKLRPIVIGLSFVWMAFVYASFYLVQQQRPITAANLQAVGALLLDALAAGAILAVGAGVGRRVCRWMSVPLQRAEELVLGAGVGLGVLSLAVLGLGLLGWLSRWAMALLLGGLALCVAPDLVATAVAVRQVLAGLRSDHRPPRLVGFYVGATFLLALLPALAPPTDWDGLFYHLTVPRLYVQAGRIAPVTDMPHQFFPGLIEMLYLAAMLLRGDVAAKLLHYGYMLLLGGLVYVMAQRHVGRGCGWPAVGLYAAIPMVAVLGGWAYNDLALAFYQVAALYALLNGLRRGGLSWVALSAICCGLAMGVKYTSLVCPLVIVGGIIWHALRTRSLRAKRSNLHSTLEGVALAQEQPTSDIDGDCLGAKGALANDTGDCFVAKSAPRNDRCCFRRRGASAPWATTNDTGDCLATKSGPAKGAPRNDRCRLGLRALGLFCVVALLVAAPWYARNVAFTGNPVYPFAYRLFGGPDASSGVGWNEWRAAWYARAGSGLGSDLLAWLRLPWTLTLGLRDMNFYDGRMGPLFLLALPFLIAWSLRLLRRPGPHTQGMGMLIVFALAQYLLWAVGAIHSQSLFQSRLLLPAFVALCAPMAHVYDELGVVDTPALSLRRLIGLSVVLVLAANLCYQFLDTLRARPLPVLLGEESREAYLARTLGAHYGAMELVNERVPEEGRVLLLWEPRSYYSRRWAQPDAILDRWAWLLYRHRADLAAIAAELEEEGYTHVLLHRAGAEFVRREQGGMTPPLPWGGMTPRTPEGGMTPWTSEGGMTPPLPWGGMTLRTPEGGMTLRTPEGGMTPPLPWGGTHGRDDFVALDAFLVTYGRQEGRVGEAYELYRLSAP